ncbi:MAG: hypothetical protein O2794_00160 [bacterium]|nr:hypothetical protein [bacterium]
MKGYSEIILASLVLVLLGLVAHPMPGMTIMVVTPLLVLAFGGFVALLWKERARDEREEMNRMNADRIAFLVGSAAITVGIMVGSFSNEGPDNWLLFALGAMVLGKIITHFLVRHRQ